MLHLFEGEDPPPRPSSPPPSRWTAASPQKHLCSGPASPPAQFWSGSSTPRSSWFPGRWSPSPRQPSSSRRPPCFWGSDKVPAFSSRWRSAPPEGPSTDPRPKSNRPCLRESSGTKTIWRKTSRRLVEVAKVRRHKTEVTYGSVCTWEEVTSVLQNFFYTLYISPVP